MLVTPMLQDASRGKSEREAKHSMFDTRDQILNQLRAGEDGRPPRGMLPIRSSSERTHSGGSRPTCSIPCRLRTAICRYVVPLLSYRSIRVKA